MILDNFRQDVRIGLRVLFKEKIFCFLAVLILALGICGVTTQFTIVNAFLLRGFSFPHTDRPFRRPHRGSVAPALLFAGPGMKKEVRHRDPG